MHCGVLSSTPGFYPLNARICLPPGCDNQKCPQILPNVAWKAKSPPTLSSLQEIMHWAGRVRGGRKWTKQSAEHLFSLGLSLTLWVWQAILLLLASRDSGLCPWVGLSRCCEGKSRCWLGKPIECLLKCQPGLLQELSWTRWKFCWRGAHLLHFTAVTLWLRGGAPKPDGLGFYPGSATSWLSDLEQMTFSAMVFSSVK